LAEIIFDGADIIATVIRTAGIGLGTLILSSVTC